MSRDTARVTYGELLELARAAEGVTLETVTGKKVPVGDCARVTRNASYLIGLLRLAESRESRESRSPTDLG